MQPLQSKKVISRLGSKDSELKKYFKQRALAIKHALEIELQNPNRNDQKHSYIDLAGDQIQKLLQVARKKRKERAREGQLSPVEDVEKLDQELSDADKGSEPERNITVERDIQSSAVSASEGNHSQSMQIGFNESISFDLKLIFGKVNNIKTLFRKFGLENDKMTANLINSKKNHQVHADCRVDTEEDSEFMEEKRIQGQLLTF